MMSIISSITEFSFKIGEEKIIPFDIFLRIILPIIGILIVVKLIRLLVLKVIVKRMRIKEKSQIKINRYLKIIVCIIVLLSCILIIGGYFDYQIPQYISDVMQAFENPFFTTGSTKISIITLLLLIPISYFAHVLSKYLKNLVDHRLLKRLSMDKSAKFGVAALTRYIAFVIIILIGLSFIGIDLSAIAVLIGVMGIGIGFGLQNIVANFFAGLVIIVERPIKEGDRIIANGIEGDILKIRLRSTVINTLTNETLIIPNSHLVDQSIHNYSHKSSEIIIINRIQVSYTSDLELVKKIICSLAENNPFIVSNKSPKVFFTEFKDSGIQLELWTWISDAHFKISASSWNNFQIWKVFKEQGIIIPFPQLDLHIKREKIPP